MRNKVGTVTIVILFVIFGVGIYTYQREIEKKVENLTTQTLEIKDVRSPRVYALSKLENQKSIYQLQLTIKGELAKNCTLYLGPKSTNFVKEIRIKNGKVETALISDWNSDSLYIKVENLDGGKGNLEIEYQFLGAE